MPKFSIIIPVYNVAPYLRECLDSVLAQTFTDWEAICVDDGSTDGSGAILDEYKEKVEKLGGGGQRTGKFVVIHQQNAGVSVARNAALDVARGEWFLFLDGDDLFRPDALEHIYQVVMENPCEGVLFQPYVEHLEREDVVPTDRFVVIAKMRNGAHLMTDEISANGFPFGRVYRRVIFGWLRFPEGVGMAEDVYFWSDAIGVDADWVAVKGSYYFYRQRDESACRRCDFAHYSQIVDVNLHVAKRLMQYEGASAVRAYWSRYHWSCEQVKDAFFSWRNYTESQKKRILQYKKDMEGLVADIPFSRDFKVRYFLYENHLSVLKGPIVQVLRCARGVKRRLERICKGRVK